MAKPRKHYDPNAPSVSKQIAKQMSRADAGYRQRRIGSTSEKAHIAKRNKILK